MTCGDVEVRRDAISKVLMSRCRSLCSPCGLTAFHEKQIGDFPGRISTEAAYVAVVTPRRACGKGHIHVQCPTGFAQIPNLLQQHTHFALPVSAHMLISRVAWRSLDESTLTDSAFEKSSRYPARLKPTCSLAASFAAFCVNPCWFEFCSMISAASLRRNSACPSPWFLYINLALTIRSHALRLTSARQGSPACRASCHPPPAASSSRPARPQAYPAPP